MLPRSWAGGLDPGRINTEMEERHPEMGCRGDMQERETDREAPRDRRDLGKESQSQSKGESERETEKRESTRETERHKLRDGYQGSQKLSDSDPSREGKRDWETGMEEE